MEQVRFDGRITVGEQPDVGELADLRQAGFASVIDLRMSGEQGEQIEPNREHELAMNLGMRYVHIPVDPDHLDSEEADRFRAALESLPKPVYVHCSSGKRAGAMAMIHVARERDLTGDQTLQKAQDIGFVCDNDNLERFVRRCVDNR